MTTRKIMELTEADEPISPYAFGPEASIQRGRRSMGPRFKRLPFEDFTLTDEQVAELRFRRLKGRVI